MLERNPIRHRDRATPGVDAGAGVAGRRWVGIVGLMGAFVAVSAGGCQRQEVLVGEPRTLMTSGASNPTVAVTEDGGTVYVAWVGAGESGGDVYLARLRADGRGVGDPVRVNDIPGDADPHEQAPAQVALGPGGEVYVVWQRKIEAAWLDFGGADLRFARSLDGGRTFEPAATVNDNDRSSPARISFHDLAVGSDGRIFVSWIDARERDRAREEVYRAGSMAGTLDHHARHEAGEAAEPGTEVRIATSVDGGRTFGASAVVDGNSCPCCRTTLAVSRDGTVYVAWRKIFDGRIRDVAIARAEDGGTFTPAHAIHPDRWEFSACPHAGPSLALDSGGRLHAAWYSGAEDRQGLWYSSSDDSGESFARPVAILTDEWVPPSQARLAADGNRVWVAWDDLRETERRVHLAVVENDRVRRGIAGGVGRSPAVAARNGHGVFAWLDGEAVRVVLFATPAVEGES